MLPMLSLVLAGLAGAAEAAPLTVDWTHDEPVWYHSEARIQTPNGFLYVALNKEVRAMHVDVVSDLSCNGEERGKRGWKVICKIDQVKLSAAASPSMGNPQQDKLDSIMAEGVEILTGAQVEMEVRSDGHIKLFDLEGLGADAKSLSVKRNQIEQLRQIMKRALAPIGVQAPKDGEGAKPWKHKGMPLFYELMSMTGTAGGLVHKYKVDKSGGELFIVGEGHGNLNVQGGASVAGGTGASAAGGPSTTPAFNLVSTTQTRWDTELGLPAYSEAASQATATASNTNLSGQPLFAYAGFIARVNKDGTQEGLQAKK